jgi:hypothetical protein
VTALERYVRRVADELNLTSDWDVSVVRSKDVERASIGHVFMFVGKATVSVNPKDWKKATGKQRRHLIVHELLHLHLRTYTYASELDGHTHDAAEEMMVERLTRIIAPHLPLPPKAAKP